MESNSYCNHFLLTNNIQRKSILCVRLPTNGTVITKYNSSQNLDLVNKRMCFCEQILFLRFKEDDDIKNVRVF